jgi:hypothetical protein
VVDVQEQHREGVLPLEDEPTCRRRRHAGGLLAFHRPGPPWRVKTEAVRCPPARPKHDGDLAAN